MPRNIRFAAGRPLPIDIVTQPCGILAKRGWGKTYAAKVLFEGMFGAGAQVIAIDPVGVWHGLNTSADGKSPGLPIPIFGGLHGDIPLAEGDAEAIAQVIVDEKLSAVIDVSMLSKSARQRFVGSFCLRLFHLKKSDRSPMHILFEEAQLFAPQRVPKGAERMLGAVEDLCRLGRNFGMGFTLVSQRPQSVNKEVLNQCEVLVVGQISGPHERKAIEGWIIEQGLDVAKLVADLPSLQQGNAFFWSPSWLRTCEKIQVETIKTLDTSSTPKVGAKTVRTSRSAASAVNVDALQESLKAAGAAAKADDPKTLRRRIIELEKEAGKKPQPTIEVVEVPLLDEADRDLLTNLHESTGRLLTMFTEFPGELSVLSQRIGALVGKRRTVPDLSLAKARAVADGGAGSVATSYSPPPSAPSSINGLSKGESKLLTAIVQCGGSATGKRASMISGYSFRSSTMRNLCSALRKKGLIEGSLNGTLAVTAAGGKLAANVEPLPSGENLRAYWVGKVSGGAPRAILSALIAAYPDSLGPEEIEVATAYSATSSTLRNALSTLRTLELIEGRGEVHASDELFLEMT